MKKINSLFLIIILSTPFITFALTTPDVVVSPDSTNHYGEYTVDSRLEGIFSRVEANTDFIVITFDSSTIIPESINPSHVTVNSVASNEVNIAGQEVSILSPVELRRIAGGERDFTVVIAAAAKIRNPADSGSYNLYVHLEQSYGDTIEGPELSNPYTIYLSTSMVSPAAVSPTPTVAGQSAAYNIAFNVGAGGYLTSGSSNMTIGFDPNTSVPNGSLSGVTVNGTSAIAVANNDTVVVTTPVDIDNDGSVTINFALGAGISNPSPGGKYVLAVKTSSENTYVDSDSFTIASPGDFTISEVDINPNVINTAAEYYIEFITSSSGALIANTDTITTIVQPNTFIPQSISGSNIVVSSGGFSDNVSVVSVINSNQLNEDTLLIVTPINIGNTSTANITISSAAGILNPSEVGNYSLAVKTSQDTSWETSNPYMITYSSTTVSQANVSPISSDPSDVTSYEIDFNLGSKGRLHPGVSSITFVFNQDYTISSNRVNYDITRISINRGSYINIDTTNIFPNNSNKTVTITVPTNVVTKNSDNIILILDGTSTDPITNPSSSGNYTLGVKTSVEPTVVSSVTYAIGGDSVDFQYIALSDSTVNSVSQYTLNFDLSTRMTRITDDYIKVIFPEGTNLPSSIPTSSVTINGSNALSVTVVQSTRTVTASIPQWNLNPNSNVTLIFLSSAGIVNPAVPSATFYQAVVSTNKDIYPVNTPSYNITGDNTSVVSDTASANPSVRGASNVSYTINFTTSSTGKLVGGAAAGSSTITVDFDTVTVIPSSISPAYVKVNTVSSQSTDVLSSGNGGVVRLTVPDGMTLNNSSAVTVLFEQNAGLSTRDYAGTYNLRIRTSSDTTFSDTTGTAGDYTITDAQDLYISSVTPNPTTQNAAAGYSINFTTGSLGALSAGYDSIRITFPSNTSLPSVINSNDVTINGDNPPSNPRISNNLLVIAVPDTIAPLASVTVLINQSANIINPTLVQSYTLSVSTDAETGPFTSPSYNITQTSTTVSVASVSVSPASLSTGAKYVLDFNTGNNGRLVAGTSTITVTFNASTTVNGTPANYDSTYIIVDGFPTQILYTNISIVGRSVTMIVPSGISIDNNDHITLIINRDGSPKPITNPSSSGSYTLQVRTSVETSNITSNSYTISSVAPVTNVTMSVTPDIVNAVSTDTIGFRVQNPLTAGSGTITIIFPYNTFLPTSIATSNVRVASGATDPPTSYNDADAVAVNTSTRTVTITIPANISANHYVRVAFLIGAGLENPSIYGSYTVQVKTSGQPLEATSSSYDLQPSDTQIYNFSINITPKDHGQEAQFRYRFTTGARGRLVSGISTITLMFPDDITFSLGEPATSKVTVNSTPAAGLDLRLGSGTDPDTLEVTVPSSVTIGNNTVVTVLIDSTAGVLNASSYEILTYSAFTSVETTTESDDYSLPVELSSFSIEKTEGIVELKWITESEINNAYWILDRKELTPEEFSGINASQLKINDTQYPFRQLARVDGHGTTSMRKEYTYIDSSVVVGSIYAYRLADVSFSGDITYHNILFAEVKAPLTFKLYQNYPNPFNPNTTITYSIPKPAKVELKIYTILGQEVITLYNGIRNIGTFQEVWDGCNSIGQRVASGIYLYIIQVQIQESGQQYNEIKKMVLLK